MSSDDQEPALVWPVRYCDSCPSGLELDPPGPDATVDDWQRWHDDGIQAIEQLYVAQV